MRLLLMVLFAYAAVVAINQPPPAGISESIDRMMRPIFQAIVRLGFLATLPRRRGTHTTGLRHKSAAAEMREFYLTSGRG